MDSPHLKFRHATRPRRARHGAVSGWVRQRHGCLSGMGVSAALGSQRQGCVNGKGAVSGYNSLLMMLMVFVFLKCVYTIQLIVQPVVQLVLLCKRCFISRPILCYVIGINIICFFICRYSFVGRHKHVRVVPPVCPAGYNQHYCVFH